MDIIHCSQEEWNDSQRMFSEMDTALSHIGYTQPQCSPMVTRNKLPLRHMYYNGKCIGYVEE